MHDYGDTVKRVEVTMLPEARKRSVGPSGGRASGPHCGVRVIALLTGLLCVLVGAAPAWAGTPPTVNECEMNYIHATRAYGHCGGVDTYGAPQSEVREELGESENGPFILVDSSPTAAKPDHEFEQLVPDETYYARFTAVSSAGSGSVDVKFTTRAPEAPEIDDMGTTHIIEQDNLGIYARSAAFAVRKDGIDELVGESPGGILTNGSETEYRFDYALPESGHTPVEGSPLWLPFSSGASGRITVAEDSAGPEAHLTGLTPETLYYARVTATNAVGAAPPQIFPFETLPAHPEATYGLNVHNLTATSAQGEAEFYTRSSESHWRFEYATSEDGPWSIGPEGTVSASEASEHSSTANVELTGLNAGTTYYLRFHIENGHPPVAESPVRSFETPGAPSADTFAVHALHGEALRGLGEVGFHGYKTLYYFQYVTQSQFERAGFAEAVSTAEVNAGGGGSKEDAQGQFKSMVVGEDFPDLVGGETYHYRLVATNASPGDPVVYGAGQTLTVPVAASTGGGEECSNEKLRTGASAGLPDCRSYELVTPADKGGAMDIFKYGVQTQGWLVGEDGEHFLMHAPGVQWGSSPDTVAADYFFTRSSSGWRMTSARPEGEAGPDSYLPDLFSADLTQAGLEVGWSDSEEISSSDLEYDAGSPGGPYTTVASVPRGKVGAVGGWVAASEDFSKLILQVEDHTLLGRSTGTTSGDDLYEYYEGQLRQVNVLTNGKPIDSCGAKIAEGVLVGDPAFGNVHAGVHSVSSDGSRVFFTSDCGHDLYVRVNGVETVDIGEYRLLADDATGSILLLEKQNDGMSEIFLYETEMMTPKLLFSTHREFNLGFVTSKDLSVIYFKSSERLVPETPTGEGTYIYRYDVATMSLRFIADGGGNEIFTSPDGRYLYWTGSLHGLAGSEGESQVYRYDNGENMVQCMSCASPSDPEPKLEALFFGEGDAVSNSVPARTVASANGDYVFFDTPSALVPQDVDGEVEHIGVINDAENPSNDFSTSSDVYEWRKDGVDGCSRVRGCVALISGGTGGFRTALLGTTPSGRDVFLLRTKRWLLRIRTRRAMCTMRGWVVGFLSRRRVRWNVKAMRALRRWRPRSIRPRRRCRFPVRVM